MTGALLDRPGTLFTDGARDEGSAAPADCLGGGSVTLEQLLTATLHAAGTDGSAECPVCRARMTYARVREGATHDVTTRDAVECGGCGSRLS